LIIAALTTVHNTILTIDLRFRAISLISIVSMIATGVTGLVLAFNGWGVWALVFQTLVGQIVTSTCIWYYSRWTPKMIFSIDSFKQLWGYGSKLLGSSLVNTIYTNIYTLVIGRKFTSSDVGFYNRGNQFALLPTQTVQDMALKVNFPILAKIQDDDERLLNAYKKLLTVPLYILYPILVGMAVTADPLIRVLIGEKWLPCVPIMQVLCIGYMFSPLTHINLNLLYVKGRTDLVLKLELLKKPIAFLILLATLPFGIIVMVIGKALYEFVAFSFNCYYTGKLLNYGEWKQLKILMPIYLNCLIMAIFVDLSMTIFESPLAKLCVGITVGLIAYMVFSIISQDASFCELKGVIMSKWKKNEG
jgi:O-antigen/teichoic acid export membrane protein